MSMSGMEEQMFKEAIVDQYSDLYWDEDLLHEMYRVVTPGAFPHRCVRTVCRPYSVLRCIHTKGRREGQGGRGVGATRFVRQVERPRLVTS